MTSGLLHLGYSLPEGQAGKLNFFIPCNVTCVIGQSNYFQLVLLLRQTFEDHSIIDQSINQSINQSTVDQARRQAVSMCLWRIVNYRLEQ